MNEENKPTRRPRRPAFKPRQRADDHKLMHGGVRFALMVALGFVFSFFSSIYVLGHFTPESRDSIRFTVFSASALTFLSAIVLGPCLKWWGIAGFVLGMCLALSFFALGFIICGGPRYY